MTIQSYELVRTNIKETKQTTHDFDFKPFFAIQELGVPTTTSFCGGRTDASNDDGYSDFLSVGSSELNKFDKKIFELLLFYFSAKVAIWSLWRCWTTEGGGQVDGAHPGHHRHCLPLHLYCLFHSQIFCFTNHVRTPLYSKTLRCSMLLALP